MQKLQNASNSTYTFYFRPFPFMHWNALLLYVLTIRYCQKKEWHFELFHRIQMTLFQQIGKIPINRGRFGLSTGQDVILGGKLPGVTVKILCSSSLHATKKKLTQLCSWKMTVLCKNAPIFVSPSRKQ